jgi:hypothetical protein
MQDKKRGGSKCRIRKGVVVNAGCGNKMEGLRKQLRKQLQHGHAPARFELLP